MGFKHENNNSKSNYSNASSWLKGFKLSSKGSSTSGPQLTKYLPSEVSTKNQPDFIEEEANALEKSSNLANITGWAAEPAFNPRCLPPESLLFLLTPPLCSRAAFPPRGCANTHLAAGSSQPNEERQRRIHWGWVRYDTVDAITQTKFCTNLKKCVCGLEFWAPFNLLASSNGQAHLLPSRSALT